MRDWALRVHTLAGDHVWVQALSISIYTYIEIELRKEFGVWRFRVQGVPGLGVLGLEV